MEVRTGAEFPVLKDYEADAVIGWAPRGRTLIYVQERVDESDLWAIDLRDPRQPGKPRLVKRHFRGEPLMITESGDFYFVEKGRSSVDVQVARFDLATGKMREPPSAVAPEVPGVKSWPVWSPDGRRLGFSLEQQNAFCTWSPNTDEVREYSLVDRLKRHLMWTRWSPDGSYVLGWSTSQDGHLGRYRLDLHSGQLEPIPVRATPGTNDRRWTGWFASFGPDQGVFYYLSQEWRGANGEERVGQIVRHDLGTQQETLLAEWVDPWVHGPFELSPDGKRCCLVSKADQSRVVLRTLDREESRELFTTDAFVLSLRWTPDGKRLVYVLARDWEGEENSEVWSRPVDGGEPVKLDLALPGVRSISIHPDNEQLALQTGKLQPDQVWMMQNLLPPALDQGLP
jgi:Tol biopolymer transport system component